MMTIRSTTTLARRVCARWRVRAALVSAALVLGVGSLILPTTVHAQQYDPDFYDFCIKDLRQSKEYCCAHADGVMKNGDCLPG